MLFKIFTLHPDIFESFTKNALIARGVAKKVIEFQLINWRDKNGIGNYKQVDDSPFGGGSGMVLMAEPIVKSMEENGCFEAVNNPFEGVMPKASGLGKHTKNHRHSGLDPESPTTDDETPIKSKENSVELKKYPVSSAATPQEGNFTQHNSILVSFLNNTDTAFHESYLPNNAQFCNDIKLGKKQTKKVNIMMTPRGFPMNQKVVEWLASDFDEINILCGRYEGFDERVKDYVDLELSIGNFVLNGGEVGAMCLAEAVSRLVPDFITKNNSVLHDSFSSGLNEYKEFQFDNSKTQYKNNLKKSISVEASTVSRFSLDKKNNVVENLDSPVSINLKGQRKADEAVLASSREGILRYAQDDSTFDSQPNLFDNNWWKSNILHYIEHPQYTRPEIWRDISVPAILKTGDHAKIQKWRKKWY